MSQKSIPTEDLAVVARRRHLTADEARRLAELGKDPAEAAVTLAGQAFDAQNVESAGDDMLAVRMAKHAISVGTRPALDAFAKMSSSSASSSNGSAGRGSLLRRGKRSVLIAAAVGLAAAAAAGTGRYVLMSRAARLHAAVAIPTGPSPVESATRIDPQRIEERHQETQEPANMALDDPKTLEPTAAVHDRDLHPLTAELLFSRGNSARRSGRIAEATGTYEQLLSNFPESPEAQVVRVSLGNVLLERGRASRALGLFDQHLARGSQLAEEALYGKARALRALGRLGEERLVWQTLATKYPNSIYARSARERLESDR